MKRYIIHIILLIGLASCHDTYPGLTLDMSGDDIDWGPDYYPDSTVVNKDRMPILISMIDPSFTTLSSARSAEAGIPAGSGAFDINRPDTMHQAQWDNAIFRVFGFRKSDDADFSATRGTDSTMCIIDNAPAKVTDLNSLMLNFNTEDGDNTSYYYNSSRPLAKYNFYAYYLDNLETEETTHMERTKDSICVHFEIDGSQDLLTGVARLTKKQQAKIEAHEEKDSLKRHFYSQYSASRDIYPVLDMDHQLSRLNFYIYPGDVGCDSIKIYSISVESKYQGRLVVAHRDSSHMGVIFDNEDTRWLSLREEGTEPQLDTLKYWIPYLKELYDIPTEGCVPVYERRNKKVGESMLLPPSTSYHIKVISRMYGTDNQFDEYETFYDITNKTGFKPNYEYRVRIALYGPKELAVDAVLEGWKPGDDVFWDEEQLFDKQ